MAGFQSGRTIKVEQLLCSFHSASRGDPSHLGEHKAGPAGWTRRSQAQRHLCVCTNRQWEDSCICHTCHTGELPASSFKHLIRMVTVSLQGKECCFYPQALMERVVCEVRALAVLPTKELTQQVRTFSKSKFSSVETKAQLTSDVVAYRSAKCSRRTQRELL